MGRDNNNQRYSGSLPLYWIVTLVVPDHYLYSLAQALALYSVSPDTGSGAGYCATRHKMKTLPSTNQEDQLAAELKPSLLNEKKAEKDGGDQTAMINEQLMLFLRTQEKVQTMFLVREEERKETIELVQLPRLRKVRPENAHAKFRIWKKLVIWFQKEFQMTNQETAKMVSEQAQGQARGIICRTMQYEDFVKIDALEKLMTNLENAYANYTFYDHDEVVTQKQKASPKKKPEPKRAEQVEQSVPPKAENEAHLCVEVDNSTNTSCVIPTFKDCTFHHCNLPDIKTSKTTEEGVATPEAKEGVVTPEAKVGVVTPEDKESVVIQKEEGVATPEVEESVVTLEEERKGVVTPGEEKQTKIQERSPET